MAFQHLSVLYLINTPSRATRAEKSWPAQEDRVETPVRRSIGSPPIKRIHLPTLCLLIALLLNACIQAPSTGEAASQPAEIGALLGNLGDHTHPITTDSELAQKYFDEGFILAYGFNHGEAIRSFQDALKLDPGCAMCYWGIAYALGPNINAPMDPAAESEAWFAVQKALELAPHASAVEQAYIEALSHRYAEDSNAAPEGRPAALDLAYADAMRTVVQEHPEVLDAATLFAEALMDLSPWNYWTKDGQQTEYTAEILATLESVLERNPDHIGAIHFYIHATEASQTPEMAEPYAERLEGKTPGAGHLVHMPGHTYWRVGRYQDAYRINEHAIHADEHIVGGTPDVGAHTFYSLAYYPHNIHFLFAAAQMQGRSAAAMTAARKLVAEIPADAYPGFPGLEDFRPIPLFGLVRFGLWDAILAEPQPDATYQYETAIWHWARGMAFTRTGELDQATAEYNQLVSIAETAAMDELILYSFAQASTMHDIASHLLAGELAGAQGDTAKWIAELEEAVTVQDSLHYIEPPAWHYPVRHYLGATFLELGRAAEAEAVYHEDLRQYPKNGWSLFGLAQSLEAQGKTAEAAETQKQFEEAWQHADVTLMASRF